MNNTDYNFVITNDLSKIISQRIMNLEHRIEHKRLWPPRSNMVINKVQKSTNSRNCYNRKCSINLYKYANTLCVCVCVV